jgi:RNA polymerase sigma-70 factor (ECF subfamily)
MIVLILPETSPDDDLLKEVQRAEKSAVIATYERYFASLYQYTRLKVGDSTLAEDIVSEVFVTLIESLGTATAPRQHLRGWLFQVARSHISKHIGDQRHLGAIELEEWMPAPHENNPEVQVMAMFDLQRVRHALRMLTNDHQEVLILRFGQRLSLQETADVMGKSLSAVKSLQFRAVETLRGILVGGEA